MSEETQITSTEEQPTNSTPEEKGGQGSKKMFTQEEVNRIVAERLTRERAKGQQPAPDQREQELTQKEQELTQKEQLAEGREWLVKHGYPASLAGIVGAKPLPQFKDAVHNVDSVFREWQKAEASHEPPPEKQTADSLFRKAFGLNRKD